MVLVESDQRLAQATGAGQDRAKRPKWPDTGEETQNPHTSYEELIALFGQPAKDFQAMVRGALDQGSEAQEPADVEEIPAK